MYGLKVTFQELGDIKKKKKDDRKVKYCFNPRSEYRTDSTGVFR